MTIGAIGSSASWLTQSTSALQSQPRVSAGRDADGDNDGSKPGEVEKPRATSTGSVGSLINTTA